MSFRKVSISYRSVFTGPPQVVQNLITYLTPPQFDTSPTEISFYLVTFLVRVPTIRYSVQSIDRVVEFEDGSILFIQCFLILEPNKLRSALSFERLSLLSVRLFSYNWVSEVADSFV
jgi:hypothetical protein